MKSKILFFISSLMISSIVSWAGKTADKTPAELYREAIGEASDLAASDSKVVTELSDFVDRIKDYVKDAPFRVMEFVGYSGAGYADLETYKAKFTEEVLEAREKLTAEYGDRAPLVLILGGSIDGFGVAYEILHDLRKSDQLQNTIVTGMVSDAVVKYHIEGAEKGWGDVISPHQDIIYLMRTYQNEDGSQSWELKKTPKSRSHTVGVMIELAQLWTNQGTIFSVYEGGGQALAESIELFLEARLAPPIVGQKTQIRLHTGYAPGKPKKDKGYRAATQLVTQLKDFFEEQSTEVRLIEVQDLPRISTPKDPNETRTLAKTLLSEAADREAGPEVVRLAAKLHNSWRAPRWIQEEGRYEPRPKEVDGVVYDIANLDYVDLPEKFKVENRISAKIAMDAVRLQLMKFLPLDRDFIERIASILHDKWLERNGSWASDEQKLPFEELSQIEADKDRDIVWRAIETIYEERKAALTAKLTVKIREMRKHQNESKVRIAESQADAEAASNLVFDLIYRGKFFEALTQPATIHRMAQKLQAARKERNLLAEPSELQVAGTEFDRNVIRYSLEKLAYSIQESAAEDYDSALSDIEHSVDTIPNRQARYMEAKKGVADIAKRWNDKPPRPNCEKDLL